MTSNRIGAAIFLLLLECNSGIALAGLAKSDEALLYDGLRAYSSRWTTEGIERVVRKIAQAADDQAVRLDEKDIRVILRDLPNVPNFLIIEDRTHPLVATLIEEQVNHSVNYYIRHGRAKTTNQSLKSTVRPLLDQWAAEMMKRMPDQSEEIAQAVKYAEERIRNMSESHLLPYGAIDPTPEAILAAREKWKSLNPEPLARAHAATGQSSRVFESQFFMAFRPILNSTRIEMTDEGTPSYREAKRIYKANIPAISEWYSQNSLRETERLRQEVDRRELVEVPAEGALRNEIRLHLNSLDVPSAGEIGPAASKQTKLPNKSATGAGPHLPPDQSFVAGQTKSTLFILFASVAAILSLGIFVLWIRSTHRASNHIDPLTTKRSLP